MAIIKKILKISISVLVISTVVTAMSGCHKKENNEAPVAGAISEELETVNLGLSIVAEDIEIFLPPEVYEDSPDITLKKIKGDPGTEPADSEGVGDAYQITTSDKLKAPVLITLDYDPEILPADEVVVVSEEDKLLAVGKAHLSADYMLAFQKGIAVKVRYGIDKLKKEK